ncbi:MAG: alpha/beta hydrolase [Planctomycetes bacterium]|nr:alpha/beta hydrolase [Planctomycetota bacterium]
MVVRKIALVFSICVMVSGCGATNIFFQPAPPPDDTAYVTTSDGWKLAIDRFMPRKASTKRPPVILCHGFTYNGNFWNIEKERSFARQLCKRGYDTWVVWLRGTRKTTKEGVAERDVKHLPDNFDDYVHKDLPAIIDYVKKATKRDKVIWIGHSMGGMVMYAYLETEKPENIYAFVAIASPMYMPKPMNDILENTVKNKNMLKLASAFIGTKAPSQLFGPLGKRAEVPQYQLFHNYENMTYGTLVRERLYVVEDAPIGVHEQMDTFLEKGQMLSADGKINYTKDLTKVKVPILLVAGLVDYMAPPEVVRYAYNRVSSEDKTFRLFCTANGSKENYGHDDLVIGKHASVEVFPYILFWLERQCGQFNKACLMCH